MGSWPMKCKKGTICELPIDFSSSLRVKKKNQQKFVYFLQDSAHKLVFRSAVYVYTPLVRKSVIRFSYLLSHFFWFISTLVIWSFIIIFLGKSPHKIVYDDQASETKKNSTLNRFTGTNREIRSNVIWNATFSMKKNVKYIVCVCVR